MALTYTPSDELGTPCPDFELHSIFGKKFSLKDFTNGHPLLFMFICNHCPYVKAIEGRLIQLTHDLKTKGINVVAICSNDEKNYPDDSVENLKRNAEEKNFPFTYLHDEDQSVAKIFGAVCTPDFFLYDKNLKLAYRGRLDDAWKDENLVTKRELYQAALELNDGKNISFQATPSMGCSIKWIKN